MLRAPPVDTEQFNALLRATPSRHRAVYGLAQDPPINIEVIAIGQQATENQWGFSDVIREPPANRSGLAPRKAPLKLADWPEARAR